MIQAALWGKTGRRPGGPENKQKPGPLGSGRAIWLFVVLLRLKMFQDDFGARGLDAGFFHRAHHFGHKPKSYQTLTVT